jgi:diguanylate cyclase (GGDEF)-like protein
MVKHMDETELLRLIKEAERENRILKQKLLRSEQNRHQLEEMLDTHSNALKVRNSELEESRELLRLSEARYRELALHDTLTGLPNRAFFNANINHILSSAKSCQKYVALLFMDLDLFKNVNDALGHKAGDIVLIQAAERLLTCIRNKDIVARLGGDEFAIVLPDIENYADAEFVAERVIRTISKPFEFDGETCCLGVSIGISLYPADTEDYDKLLQLADKAMYRVKKEGKNNYMFYHCMKCDSK